MRTCVRTGTPEAAVRKIAGCRASVDMEMGIRKWRGAEREINPPPLGGFSSSYLLSKKVSDIAVEIYKPLLPLYPSILPSPRSL